MEYNTWKCGRLTSRCGLKPPGVALARVTSLDENCTGVRMCPPQVVVAVPKATREWRTTGKGGCAADVANHPVPQAVVEDGDGGGFRLLNPKILSTHDDGAYVLMTVRASHIEPLNHNGQSVGALMSGNIASQAVSIRGGSSVPRTS